MNIIANILIFLIILAVSGGLALLSLDPLGSMGVFGSCFEGGCGYAAVFVGFPVITITLTVAGCLIWYVAAKPSANERRL